MFLLFRLVLIYMLIILFLILLNQNMKLYMLLCILLICQINTLANTFQEIVHEDSELAKVCTLEDQSVLVLSTILGVQRSKESLLDKTGDVLYGNITLQVGYTGNAQLVQPHSVNGKQPDHFLSGHNKQNIDGKLAKEFYTEFSRGSISRNFTNKNNIFDQQSTVALFQIFQKEIHPLLEIQQKLFYLKHI